MAVLDADFDRFPERDRIGNVEPVDRATRAEIEPLADRTAIEEAVDLTHTPGITEIIFATGTDEPRLTLAVDPDEIVALTPPAGSLVGDGEIAADVVSATFGLQQEVILRAVEVDVVEIDLGTRPFLTVAGVKIERILGKSGKTLVVDVRVEGPDGLRPLVFDFQSSGSPKRHGPETIAGATLARDTKRQTLHRPVDAMPHTEEVTERRFDAGLAVAIPIGAKNQLAAVELLGRHSAPDMRDRARSFEVSDDERLAGLDLASIAIPTGAIP